MESRPEQTAARDRLRRLMAHIVQEQDVVPRELFLDESNLMRHHAPHKGDQPDGEGSYADVYQGFNIVPNGIDTYRQHVAFKCMRFQTTGSDDERMIRRQVCLFHRTSTGALLLTICDLSAHAFGDREHGYAQT